MSITADKSVLKQVSLQIESDVDWAIVPQIINELVDTANAHPTCVGLAALQINVRMHVFIVKDPSTDKWLVFVNPNITRKMGGFKADNEGCMSFPGVNVNIRRHKEILMTWQDENKVKHEGIFKGFLARVIQHEYNHLNGINIVDKR